MKTTIVTQEEFAKIMECCEAFVSTSEVGHTHSTITYSMALTNGYGYDQVNAVGWCRSICTYSGGLEYTFTVPTFLYEAYIK